MPTLPSLTTALMEAMGADREPTARMLGNWGGKVVDRHVDGLMLERIKKDRTGVWLWRVRRSWMSPFETSRGWATGR